MYIKFERWTDSLNNKEIKICGPFESVRVSATGIWVNYDTVHLADRYESDWSMKSDGEVWFTFIITTSNFSISIPG